MIEHDVVLFPVQHGGSCRWDADCHRDARLVVSVRDNANTGSWPTGWTTSQPLCFVHTEQHLDHVLAVADLIEEAGR